MSSSSQTNNQRSDTESGEKKKQSKEEILEMLDLAYEEKHGKNPNPCENLSPRQQRFENNINLLSNLRRNAKIINTNKAKKSEEDVNTN